MAYQIADTHDNAAGLADVDPQPMSSGIQYPERRLALSGAAYEDGGAFTLWRFSILTPTQYDSLLTQFGLSSDAYNDVTVNTITNDRTTFANYNGTIVRPMMGEDAKFEMGFYHDVVFRVIRLEAI